MKRHDAALPSAFSLLNSEFNDFLFAPVGNDEDHRTLSVLSALTSAGLDPWQQAARLRLSPRGAAIEALASTLAALPDRAYWSFRMVTATGSANGSMRVEDVIHAAQWSRRQRVGR